MVEQYSLTSVKNKVARAHIACIKGCQYVLMLPQLFRNCSSHTRSHTCHPQTPLATMQVLSILALAAAATAAIMPAQPVCSSSGALNRTQPFCCYEDFSDPEESVIKACDDRKLPYTLSSHSGTDMPQPRASPTPTPS